MQRALTDDEMNAYHRACEGPLGPPTKVVICKFPDGVEEVFFHWERDTANEFIFYSTARGLWLVRDCSIYVYFFFSRN